MCAWRRQLTRWDIDILTEAEESERRQDEFRKRSGLFVEGLDVDDVIAGLLVTEGFTSVEDIVAVDDEELAGIEGFDESVAAELKRRAEAFLEKRDGELDEKRRELGVEDAVAEAGGFSAAQLVALGEKGVKTLDDLADLASDELIEIIGADGDRRGRGERDHHGRAPALVRRRRRGGGGGGRRGGWWRRRWKGLTGPKPTPPPRPTTRRAEDAPEKGPLRRCIVTRESGPKEGMLRFVLDPEGAWCPIWKAACRAGECG